MKTKISLSLDRIISLKRTFLLYSILITPLFFPQFILAQQRPVLGQPKLISSRPVPVAGVKDRPGNMLATLPSRDSLTAVRYKKNYYILLRFDKFPDTIERKELAAAGVHLFHYITDRSFLAEVPEGFSPAYLQRFGASGIYRLPPERKISSKLLNGANEYLRGAGSLVAVSFFGTISPEEAGLALEQAGATVVPTKIRPDKVLFIRAGASALKKIAELPYISYMAPQPLKDQALNYNNRAAHGVDAINNPSGRNLQGDGVTVGMGDDSDPYTHVDFTGRLIERFAPAIGSHGTHTSGTVGGGGILDPRYKGMAPHVRLIDQYFSDVLVNTPTYLSDFHMVLTNNSYTAYNPGCQDEGDYDFLAYYLDAQLYSYPDLLHLFAAGNDGALSCTPYTKPFGTIKSGYQCAKNTLTVGNLDNSNYTISSTSSVGPVNDGRIKPEIVAGGSNIISTFPYNTYGYNSGTSMATPTVTGAMALLVQRYRQLQGGTDPPAALLKAVACNTATDLGNPGPDYIYGFGSLNARTAVEALENHQYTSGSVNNVGTVTIPLSGIPSGLQQLKVMLYWPDVPGAPGAAIALVNNLDLSVTSPDAVIHYPLILNPAANHVNDIAIEGIDNINNIEQVVINNPPAGNFTITVKGTSIPAGPQNYVVTYQAIQPSVTLEYPTGSETLVPGETETIRWSAYGASSNTFTLEYSPDHGSSWITINNAISSASRLYSWTVPVTATSQGLIRIGRNGTGYTNISHNDFTILGQPILTVSNPCQGYAQLSWSTVTQATSYDIMQLIGDSMVKVASTTASSWLLGNLRRDSSYWLAVRAVLSTTPGRRSLAATVTPAGGACNLTALDNDYTIDSLIAPLTGRLFTSTRLGSVPIQAELKNLGTIPSGSPFSLSYRVNGGAIVTETSNAVITHNGVYGYTFTQPYDFSAPGIYRLQVWVNYPGDPQSGNDTLNRVIRQLQNDPLSLNPSFTEGFEASADTTYTSPAQGLSGGDRCDFRSNNDNGRLRTFINTGFSRTGSRSVTLDLAHYNGIATADSLITTFNLSGYSGSDQIWLNFYYRNAGINFVRPGNQVWIRGNDQSAWLPVYTLDNSIARIGVYEPSAAIDITGILKAALPAQTVSSSFQVKFGEEGYYSTNSVTTDGILDNGYTFDDITLTKASNDIGVSGLVTPVLSTICGLSNAETISLKVKNYSASSAANIPVSYSLNGVFVTEKIPSINAFDSVVYHFTKTADLSAFQQYSLSAWVSNPGDNYQPNDTLPALSFHTTPVISTFPYLEGFENGNGAWYSDGMNNSWQWGSPAKSVINKAANGAKCWVTSLNGDYNSNELSYLYSPCFDLSGLASPVLSFSHIFQTEDNCDCDYHWAEYSIDGVHWIKLGAAGSGTNWYDNVTRQAWQSSNTKWHVSSFAIPVTATSVKFRIAMNSDGATTYEGVGIDDIHIFDKAAIYSGPSITSGLMQPVSGNNWVNFDLGGRRVVSINPNGQDLGNTTVKAYINTGLLRNDGNQYYLDRNIVIQPTNTPAGKVAIRYYFLDAEVSRLIQASGCAACKILPDAYQSGITQYSSPIPAEEDGSLINDVSGAFHYILPQKEVSIIPYDNGYYAEYQVSGFSEFWINTRPAADIGITALTSPTLAPVCGLSNAETIGVKVKNYSAYTLTNIPVSYSVNGVAVTENIPAIPASDSVSYTFIQSADLSAYQRYTLNSWVSYGGDNNPGNDSLMGIGFQTTPVISVFPYLEGFENNNGYWYTNGANDSWSWGTPAKTIIDKAANGKKAWVTGLTGDYNNNELSYLYSPCFDLSGLSNPVLSFSHIFRTQDDCDCDSHWVEYSTDGINWTKLGVAGSGLNWYDDTGTEAWKASNPRWHVSAYPIPVRAADTRFRIVLRTDAATTYEGVGIDGIHLFDSSLSGQIRSPDLLLLSFSAVKTGDRALLRWNTIEETATSRFVIEKSRDSIHFFPIDSINAIGNRDTVNGYSYTDNKLWAGQNYYHLKITGADGHFIYSSLRFVSDTTSGLEVSVYPNPVQPDGRLYIASSVNCERIQLVDVSGRVILNAAAHGLLNAISPGSISRGVYFVLADTEAGRKVIKVFVK